MAGGHTHTAIAAVAGGVGTGLLIAAAPHFASWYAAGAIVSMIVTPDLDKIEPTISDTLVGWWRIPWRLFWLPYGAAIPHRCWCSHAPVIGTLGRLLYIVLVLWMASFLFYIAAPHAMTLSFSLAHFTYWLNFWGGLLGLHWRLPTHFTLYIPHTMAITLLVRWACHNILAVTAFIAPLFINDSLHALEDRWYWGQQTNSL